ncbi:MAG: hypothetical protein CL489_01040 [Acidobacteria bacterium]|nr:hypothetical protein [Acidobacteriota bacterium]|tara:strand:- start:187 stop:981 length:795 start_codon:yes stop_codon:yes gene_type:complete
MVWAHQLGGGVVKFHDTITDLDDGMPTLLERDLREMADKALVEMYDLDEDGNGTNQSGHLIPAEHISTMPIRINQPLDPVFFAECDRAIYKNLVAYCTLYPDAMPSCWWDAGGHVAVYRKGALLGMHSDNDVNYRFGDHPKDQTALFNTVSSTLVLGAGFSGGNIKFEHLKLEVRVGPGDHILFPSNYMGAHEITPVIEGTRYSYISTFGQGTSAPDRGIVIQSERKSGLQGRTWLPALEQDVMTELEADHRLSRRVRDHSDPT